MIVGEASTTVEMIFGLSIEMEGTPCEMVGVETENIEVFGPLEMRGLGPELVTGAIETVGTDDEVPLEIEIAP